MENWKKGKERERERYWESSERERTLEKRRLEQIQSRMGRASSYWKGHSKLSGSNPSAPAYPNSLSKEHTRPPLILSLSLSLSLSLFRSYYYSFLFPHTDKLNCFLAPAFLLLLFWHSHSHCGGVGGCNLQNKVRLWIFVGGVWKCETESTVMISWFSNFEKYMNLLFKE